MCKTQMSLVGRGTYLYYILKKTGIDIQNYKRIGSIHK